MDNVNLVPRVHVALVQRIGQRGGTYHEAFPFRWKRGRGLWERDWDDVVFAPHFLVYLVIAQAFLFPLLPVGPYYLLFNSTRRLHYVWNVFGKLINTKSCSQAFEAFEAIITLSDSVNSSGGRAAKCRLSVLK